MNDGIISYKLPFWLSGKMIAASSAPAPWTKQGSFHGVLSTYTFAITDQPVKNGVATLLPISDYTVINIIKLQQLP